MGVREGGEEGGMLAPAVAKKKKKINSKCILMM